MKVVVDTSVWSLSLRKKGPADHEAVSKLASLLDDGEEVLITGTILQEVLQAFRHPATARKVARYFEPLPLVELARSDYAAAAALHRRCASRGVTASTTDCQIAQAAISRNCPLLTTDRDFARIARCSDLKLL